MKDPGDRVPTLDTQIEADVSAALTNDPNVDARRIRVEVVGGTVYLRGVVLTAEEADQAYRDAQCTPRVREVVSALEVPPSDPPDNQ